MFKEKGVLTYVNADDLVLLQNNPKAFWKGVTTIGESAFNFLLEELKEIIIPEGITTIKTNAFSGSNLKKVVIPDSVTSIGDGAFYRNVELKELKLPNNLQTIGKNAFYNCEGIKELILPESLTTIGEKAFKNCYSLDYVKVPSGIKEIPKEAFYYCYIGSIELPEGLKVINESAFANNSFKNIILPESLERINAFTFYDCDNLESIKIPQNVKVLGINTFGCCTKLKKVELNEGLKVIENDAFHSCLSLESIDLPKSLQEIRGSAFYSCEDLQNIIIPNGITKLHEETFKDCYSLKNIKLSDNLKSIGKFCFENCDSLESINLPEGIEKIDEHAFLNCEELKKINIPLSVKKVYSNAFVFTNLKYICLASDGNVLLLDEVSDEIQKTHKVVKRTKENFDIYVNTNYRLNYILVNKLRQEGKLRFTPPDFMLRTFPNECFENFLINNNNVRWGRLVKQLKFDKLEDREKQNTLNDLLKIYYAIGGFSTNLAESENAYKYIVQHVAVIKDNPDANEKQIGEEIHRRFSKIELKGEYNSTFAQFFMKYYKDNPDFMRFRLKDKDDYLLEEQDYLCQAHNNFKTMLKIYPHRSVYGNEQRSLLSPKFVAEHSCFVEYDGVDQGNESLAEIIGRYGYSQEQFEQIQEIYNKAKKIKDKYVICADRANEEDCITYRVLAKDDPLGFVLGDITNCCQHIGGAGESCVDDGYTNKDAGFLVFEENIKDAKGKPTGEKRILGQAYVWYDPLTKTVCYDNIEIPTKVLKELSKGEKQGSELSSSKLLKAVEDSAEKIITAMAKRGVQVDRVTTGKSYNDLGKVLSENFTLEYDPKYAHRSYDGYTDARSGQYIIKTYHDLTSNLKEQIQSAIKSAKNNLKVIKDNIQTTEK